MTTNTDDLTFDEWFLTVDRLCTEGFGLSINDLPDHPSRDAWEDNMTPFEYLHEVLTEEGIIEE